MADQSNQQPNQPQQPQMTQNAEVANEAPVAQVALDRIHVLVRNRKQVLFDEDVKAVSSKNDTGIFDVLPEHSNFITVLKESITLHKLDGTKQVIPVQNGVMKVKDSNVKCYIDLLTTVGNTAKPQIPQATSTPQGSK